MGGGLGWFFHLISVGKADLVAVVAIGYKEWSVFHEVDNLFDSYPVLQHPQAVSRARIPLEVYLRWGGGNGPEECLYLRLFLGVKAKDRAQVGTAGPEEVESVFYLFWYSIFMWVDVPCMEVLEFYQGNKTPSAKGPALQGKFLFIDVEGWLGLVEEDALLVPGLKILGSAGVFVTEFGISW